MHDAVGLWGSVRVERARHWDLARKRLMLDSPSVTESV